MTITWFRIVWMNHFPGKKINNLICVFVCCLFLFRGQIQSQSALRSSERPRQASTICSYQTYRGSFQSSAKLVVCLRVSEHISHINISTKVCFHSKRPLGGALTYFTSIIIASSDPADMNCMATKCIYDQHTRPTATTDNI